MRWFGNSWAGAPGYITTSLLNGCSFVEGWEQNFFISKWSMQQLVFLCQFVFGICFFFFFLRLFFPLLNDILDLLCAPNIIYNPEEDLLSSITSPFPPLLLCDKHSNYRFSWTILDYLELHFSISVYQDVMLFDCYFSWLNAHQYMSCWPTPTSNGKMFHFCNCGDRSTMIPVILVPCWSRMNRRNLLLWWLKLFQTMRWAAGNPHFCIIFYM